MSIRSALASLMGLSMLAAGDVTRMRRGQPERPHGGSLFKQCFGAEPDELVALNKRRRARIGNCWRARA